MIKALELLREEYNELQLKIQRGSYIEEKKMILKRDKIKEAIKELQLIDDFIYECEYCIMFDYNSKVCTQNGCKDMQDYKFFKETK